ncbi:mid1-interacting protein 1-B [Xenopus laevis]|uniref:Mid1-interacting protein 1-B n=2 Tax=Xenopus laevis TaxID=8355 RepID=A0A1L8F2V8_XENLA|nr:mid1-interacting protein 1-B [Xenopus laevis]XP_018088497.1 mid1-interacting protein 1-B [Xenopus laevis]XP_041430577.1 mid1-interacting protein 1-B [Xenopus laevis]XP_041430578.1 mid1-interacting protein 1-B [Xenopus laevis]XP_041430579.1 mid1-interacting protein 1-B [Xenopus laevis]XP_041430580.1 mid1-interacting protein 1-B [Xenopus laevis]XP_041430581.1 mid1-interacting protein 1-B [Xenopus laevis]XP_041430582.1 mid1-interacting protein 1-B [Xenopus laevis]XP_041430583.1 mid1-interac
MHRMDVSELSPQRQSLLDAIHRFNTATTIMDETIMVPSMLRDISPVKEECGEHSDSNQIAEQKSLYESYLLLKSLRHDMKWGIHQDSKATPEHYNEKEESPEDETSDLVDQFQNHLKGLLSVLTKLTKKANLLTNSYKKQIGIGAPSSKHYSRSMSH